MRNNPWALCVVMIAAMLVLSVGGCNRTDARKHRIVIVTKAFDSEFWQTLKSGAEDAARQHPDVELSVLAPEREINMYINSPGGVVYAGFAIYDTMKMISNPISTVAVGVTASFGTVLLTAGTKGRRYALPHATIHMHQPLGGAQGQATDIEIAARQILRQKAILNNILSTSTGQPLEVIERDTDRDFYLDANGAVEYGLVDEVLGVPEKTPNVK